MPPPTFQPGAVIYFGVEMFIVCAVPNAATIQIVDFNGGVFESSDLSRFTLEPWSDQHGHPTEGWVRTSYIGRSTAPLAVYPPALDRNPEAYRFNVDVLLGITRTYREEALGRLMVLHNVPFHSRVVTPPVGSIANVWMEERGRHQEFQVVSASRTTATMSLLQLEERNRPQPQEASIPSFLIPEWLVLNARIRLRGVRSTPTSHIVTEISRIEGWFTVAESDAPRRWVRYPLRDLAWWEPVTNLQEQVMTRGQPVPSIPAPVLSTFTAPPSWLKQGTFIRTKHHRVAWVESVILDRQMVKLREVKGSAPPYIVQNTWWETPIFTIQEEWELLDAELVPVSELTCPHCAEIGVRKRDLEDPSVYSARVYECSKDHRWSFIAGGTHDGQPAVSSRFERVIFKE